MKKEMKGRKLLSKLKEKIYLTVETSLKGKDRISVAFSGGLDSSLLAKVCNDLGKKIKLITIGFEDSQDILYAIKVSKMMGLPLIIRKLTKSEIEESLKKIYKIVPYENLVEMELCLAFFFIFDETKKNNLDTVVTSLGMDALFCGFDAFRKVIKNGGEIGVKKEIEKQVELITREYEKYNKIAKYVGVDFICPFVEKDFINFSLRIPLAEKIKGPEDMLRKHILRKLSIMIGVPRMAALRLKKSLQYSSGIDKAIEKLAREKGLNKEEARRQGFKGVKEAYVNLFIRG